MKRSEKKIAALLLVLCLALAACGCNSDVGIEDSIKKLDELSEPSEIEIFYSVEKFEEHEKEGGLSYYYLPASVPEGFEFSMIRTRDGVNVSVEYSKLNKDTYSYAEERLNSIICQYILFEDAEKALDESFVKNGYEPVEYGEKTYYRWDEQNIGYEIAFIEDGDLIFMHLPAIDSFENMMKYAGVVKVSIE